MVWHGVQAFIEYDIVHLPIDVELAHDVELDIFLHGIDGVCCSVVNHQVVVDVECVYCCTVPK